MAEIERKQERERVNDREREKKERKKKREETDRERNHEWVREIEREGNIVYLTQRGVGVTEKERMNITSPPFRFQYLVG